MKSFLNEKSPFNALCSSQDFHSIVRIFVICLHSKNFVKTQAYENVNAPSEIISSHCEIVACEFKSDQLQMIILLTALLQSTTPIRTPIFPYICMYEARNWLFKFLLRLENEITLDKKWYFVTKIVLTYCEKKLF